MFYLILVVLSLLNLIVDFESIFFLFKVLVDLVDVFLFLFILFFILVVLLYVYIFIKYVKSEEKKWLI